jgi:hypothetical protein
MQDNSFSLNDLNLRGLGSSTVGFSSFSSSSSALGAAAAGVGFGSSVAAGSSCLAGAFFNPGNPPASKLPIPPCLTP